MQSVAPDVKIPLHLQISRLQERETQYLHPKTYQKTLSEIQQKDKHPNQPEKNKLCPRVTFAGVLYIFLYL